MASPCQAAQAVYDRLPKTVPPGSWLDEGVATMDVIVATATGFVNWYTTPTTGMGCVVTGGSIPVPNPFDDPDQRTEMAGAIHAYLGTAIGDDGKQALADFLFGKSRSALAQALTVESDPMAQLAWVAVADVAGITGVLPQLFAIGDHAVGLIQSGWHTGSDYLLAAVCVTFAHWYAKLSPADRAHAGSLADVAAASGDQVVRLAGQELQNVASAAEINIPSPPPIIEIPPTSIIPRAPRTWWSQSWPIVAGGAGGLVLLIAAWWRKRRREVAV